MFTEVFTHLSLYQWGKIMGMNPFGMIQVNAPELSQNDCSDILYQDDLGDNFSSRNNIADAILYVESVWRDNVQYEPAPLYSEQEIQVDSDVLGILRLKVHNKILGLGKQSKELVGTFPVSIEADHSFSIEFTDPDTADADYYEAFHTATNRNDEEPISIYQIRPLSTSLGVTSHFMIGRHKSILALPAKMIAREEYEIDNADVYASEVEIYRYERDISNSVVLHTNAGDINASSGLQIIGTDMGWIEIITGIYRVYSATVNIRHGLALDHSGMVDRSHAMNIARCSVGYITSTQLGCDSVRKGIEHWGSVPSSDAQLGRDRPITISDIDNVFGEHRGALALRNFAAGRMYP